MKQEQETSGQAEGENEPSRRVLPETLLCPICLHPIPYSKKFQCRRCGFMPG